MRKIILVMMSLLMLLTCASACGKKADKVKIDIVVAPGSSSWISTYAIREGILTSDLCDLEITLSPNFGNLMMSGNYTMGAMQCAAFALEEETNPGTYMALSTFIAGQGSEEARGVCLLCTRKDSGINKVEDIYDKVIGVSDLKGSTTSIFLGLLKKYYGKSEADLNIIDQQSTVLLELLRAGELDVALLDGSNTVAQQAYYDPNLQVIWNLDEAFYKEYGVYHAPTLLLVKTDFYKNNKKQVEAALKLLRDSRDYANENINELAEKFAVAFGQPGNAQFFIDIQKYHSQAGYDTIKGKVEDGVMAIIQLGVDRGIVSKMPDPDKLFIR
jgi:ABC-type nitrate/sulfonate/bicarbonate transport system substrate-binding protein